MDYLSNRSSFQDIQSFSTLCFNHRPQIGRALMSERNSIRGTLYLNFNEKIFSFSATLSLSGSSKAMKSQKWNQSINLAFGGGGGKRDFLPVLLAAYFGAFEDGQGRRGCICSDEKSFLEVGKIEFRLCRWRQR